MYSIKIKFAAQSCIDYLSQYIEPIQKCTESNKESKKDIKNKEYEENEEEDDDDEADDDENDDDENDDDEDDEEDNNYNSLEEEKEEYGGKKKIYVYIFVKKNSYMYIYRVFLKGLVKL